MGSSIRLGRVWGIPLGVNYSWFLVLGLVVLLLASRFHLDHRQWGPGERWALAVVTAFFFFGSVLTHELAHSLVARSRGIPVKGITLFVFGGVSYIAREANRPLVELLIALVGPLTSGALGSLFLGVWLLTPSAAPHLHAASEVLWQTNLMLAVFNMMPGFPLDGGRVLRAIAWALTGSYRLATRIATLAGQALAALLVAGGVLLTLQLQTASTLWLILIGTFLFSAATASQRQARLLEALRGAQAQDLMGTDCPSVPSWLTLEQLARGRLLRGRGETFLVSDDELSKGVLNLHDLRRIPRRRWGRTSVEQAMTPLAQVKSVGLTAPAERVQGLLDEPDTPQVLVVQEGRVLGVITRQTLARFGRTPHVAWWRRLSFHPFRKDARIGL